jgi:hypothetical protein
VPFKCNLRREGLVSLLETGEWTDVKVKGAAVGQCTLTPPEP